MPATSSKLFPSPSLAIPRPSFRLSIAMSEVNTGLRAGECGFKGAEAPATSLDGAAIRCRGAGSWPPGRHEGAPSLPPNFQKAIQLT